MIYGLKKKKSKGVFLLNFKERGMSLVEVVVGTAIVSVAITGFLTAYNIFFRVGTTTMGNVQATYLLEEGVEGVNILRDYGWTANLANLSVGAPYYLFWNGTRWTATSTVSVIDGTYTRYFILANVNRDGNDAISQDGTLDSGTKKLTVYVSWSTGATTTVKSVSSYLTNLFAN